MRRPVMYLAGLFLATGASLALAGPASAAPSYNPRHHHHHHHYHHHFFNNGWCDDDDRRDGFDLNYQHSEINGIGLLSNNNGGILGL
jgi:hypothetical protein